MAVDELPCRELVELVTDRLEGVPAPDMVERVEGHLLNCPLCEDDSPLGSIGLAGT